MTSNTIFFSYSRTDSEFVLQLAKDLRDAGAEIWLDQLDIKPGSRWDASIERALKQSTRLIVVLTPESISSNNVMDEVSFALENGKTVFPVLYRKCDTPFRLRRVQRIDFTGDYTTALNKLLEVLGYDSTHKVEIEDDEKEDISAEINESAEPENNANDISENELWEEAKNENTVSSYKKYLNETSVGLYRENALESIKNLEETNTGKQPLKTEKTDNIPVVGKKSSKSKIIIPSVVGGIVIVAAILFFVFGNKNPIVETKNNEIAIRDSLRRDSIAQVRLKEKVLAAREDSIKMVQEAALKIVMDSLRRDSIGIGKIFRGGIIFAVDDSGDHGMMISAEDLNNGKALSWDDANKICAELNTENSKYKWSLPTLTQLQDIAKLNQTQSNTIKLNKKRYWSSTPTGDLMQGYDFTGSYPYRFESNKNRSNYVRAVREF